MAGGQFNGNKNKTLPGIYIDYKTVNAAKASVGERGTIAIAKQLKWGKNNDFITITDTTKIYDLLGYDIGSDEMLFLRELTKGTNLTAGASKILLWRLSENSSNKAHVDIGNLHCEALYSGSKGNDISIVVAPVASTEYTRTYEETTREPAYCELTANPNSGSNLETPYGMPLKIAITSPAEWTVSGDNNEIATVVKNGNDVDITFLNEGEVNITINAQTNDTKENITILTASCPPRNDDSEPFVITLTEKQTPQSSELPPATTITKTKQDYYQWTVETYVDKALKDSQTVGTFIAAGDSGNIQGEISDLQANNFVVFSGTGVFEANVGAALTDGKDGTISSSSHSDFLSALGKQTFNVVVYDGTDTVLKAAYKSFVHRLCEKEGKYVVGVMANYKADSEYIINVHNSFTNGEGIALTPEQATWYVGGASAGANYNESLTYHKVPDALAVSPEYENTELSELLSAGNFLFFKLEDEILILSDVNSFTSFTTDKSNVLRKNRVIRTIMQICNDLYIGYTKQYIGKVDVNAAGVKLVKAYGIDYLTNIQANNGIKNFDSSTDFEVAEYEIDSMTIDMYIQPVDSLEKLYISIRIA